MFTPTHQPPRTEIRHCRHCGQRTERRHPDDGDSRERAICPACGTIHYVNPLLVVGTVPCLGERLLLCQRNIAPRLGKWTLPAGFMEMGETTAEGAARETVEEAGAEFDMGALCGIMSVPHVGQVHVFYLCALRHDHFAPGHETMQARLFTEAEIPWDDIAFPTVHSMLRAWWAHRHATPFPLHVQDFA